MSDGQISALFLIWSVNGLIVGVPTGALADRLGYRFALVSESILQAVGYAVWLLVPSFWGFALGFMLWGTGGALGSGALEALVYDDLKAVEQTPQYTRIQGAMTAASLLAQLPGAAAAATLYAIGGFDLVGWVSVGICLAVAAYAARLPAWAPPRGNAGFVEAELSYLQLLRSGVRESWTNPRVRVLVLLFAALFSLDAVEEYFPLLAQEWGVSTSIVPIALVAVPLLGALGASWAGRLDPGRSLPLGTILAVSAAMFAVAGTVQHAAGIAGIAAFYLGYRLVVVIVEARLQHAIEGPARATVTSVADFLVDIMCLLVYALWAWQGQATYVVLTLLIAGLTGWAFNARGKFESAHGAVHSPSTGGGSRCLVHGATNENGNTSTSVTHSRIKAALRPRPRRSPPGR